MVVTSCSVSCARLTDLQDVLGVAGRVLDEQSVQGGRQAVLYAMLWSLALRRKALEDLPLVTSPFPLRLTVRASRSGYWILDTLVQLLY